MDIYRQSPRARAASGAALRGLEFWWQGPEPEARPAPSTCRGQLRVGECVRITRDPRGSWSSVLTRPEKKSAVRAMMTRRGGHNHYEGSFSGRSLATISALSFLHCRLLQRVGQAMTEKAELVDSECRVLLLAHSSEAETNICESVAFTARSPANVQAKEAGGRGGGGGGGGGRAGHPRRRGGAAR